EKIDWGKKHIAKTSTEILCSDETPDSKEWRMKVEPWLSAIFQSEHFSLLIGSGLSSAIAYLSKIDSQGMGRLELVNVAYKDKIKSNSDKSASAMERGEANLEDDFRVALELYRGYEILENSLAQTLKNELDNALNNFIKAVLKTERLF